MKFVSRFFESSKFFLLQFTAGLSFTIAFFSAMGQMIPFPGKPGTTLLHVPPNQDTIIVYGTKPLEWSDYLGNPVPELVSAGGEAGTTTATTTPECTCHALEDGIHFNYSVKALFSKKRSWVIEKGKKDSILLKHERLHFDITELYARKIRKMFAEFNEELKKGTKHCAYVSYLYKSVENVRQQDKKENEKYDRETDHGSNRQKQKEWEEDVRKQLKELEKYK